MTLQSFSGGNEGTRSTPSTSASGAMAGAPVMPHVILRGTPYIEGTAALRLLTDEWQNRLVQTSSGDAYPDNAEEPQSTSSAIMELRRLSGLTWEQIATLFGVARRSLHFWASGKTMNAPNEERLWRVLAAVRKADRSFAAKNRAMLLDEHDGMVPFDLLVRGELDTFIKLVGVGPGRRELKRTPLSPEAQAARRPQPPEELVGALQDRVHVDVGRARPGRSVKIKK